MFKTINGWTKEKMKERIRLKNNGYKATTPDGSFCVYRTSTGNACAAGVFIEDSDVKLINRQSDPVHQLPLEILNKFPLEPYAIRELQKAHDEFESTDGDMRDHLCKWVDEKVED